MYILSIPPPAGFLFDIRRKKKYDFDGSSTPKEVQMTPVRTWFLSRSTDPISNSAEIVNLSWTETWDGHHTTDRKIVGTIYTPEKSGESSCVEHWPVQVLYVFNPMEAMMLEGLIIIGGNKNSSLFQTACTMITHLCMDLLRDDRNNGAKDLNRKLEEYQHKQHAKISSFLCRKKGRA